MNKTYEVYEDLIAFRDRRCEDGVTPTPDALRAGRWIDQLVSDYDAECTRHAEAASALPDGVTATTFAPDPVWCLRVEKLLSGIDPAEPWPDDDGRYHCFYIVFGRPSSGYNAVEGFDSREPAQKRLETIRDYGHDNEAAGEYSIMLGDEYRLLNSITHKS